MGQRAVQVAVVMASGGRPPGTRHGCPSCPPAQVKQASCRPSPEYVSPRHTHSIWRRQVLPGRLKSQAAQSSSAGARVWCAPWQACMRVSVRWVGGGVHASFTPLRLSHVAEPALRWQARECPPASCTYLTAPPLHHSPTPPPTQPTGDDGGRLQPVGEDDVGVHGGDIQVVDEGHLVPAVGGKRGGCASGGGSADMRWRRSVRVAAATPPARGGAAVASLRISCCPACQPGAPLPAAGGPQNARRGGHAASCT